MKNKILVKVYVPTIDEEYEIYIPVNESIDKVLQLIVKSIEELSDTSLGDLKNHKLLDPKTSNTYNDCDIIRDTNIKNSKKIILI